MIESYNIKMVGDKAPTIHNIITPPPDKNNYLFPSLVNKIFFNGNEIKIKLKSKKQIDVSLAGYDCFLVLVILYFDPLKKKDKYFKLNNVLLQLPALNRQKILSVKSGISAYLSYKSSIVYSASLAIEKKDTKYYCSYTVSEYYILNK